MLPINRRKFLAASAPFALMALKSPLARGAQVRPWLGHAQTFSFDGLRRRAKELSEKPYVPPAPAPDTIAKIDYDAVQKIKFRPDCALWANGPGPHPVRLFHVDKFNALPVRINELSSGLAREVVYSRQNFDYKDAAIERVLATDLGYSGFRAMDGREQDTDWLAFQGASYFRSSGEENQYGASARRHCRQHGYADRRGVSTLLGVLAGRARPRQPGHNDLRAARRPQSYRRLSVRGDQAAWCDHRCDGRAVRSHRC